MTENLNNLKKKLIKQIPLQLLKMGCLIEDFIEDIYIYLLSLHWTLLVHLLTKRTTDLPQLTMRLRPDKLILS